MPHTTSYSEWIIGERIILKSIKQFITNLSLPTIGKLNFSNLRARLRARFDAYWVKIQFKEFLSLKHLIILGFVIAVIPLFLAVMYAAYGMRETSALGRTINSEVFEQTKAIRLAMQKTADIERKAKLFVLLSDPSLRDPYEQQSYENTRASFKEALGVLLKLHVDNKIALLVNELLEKEDLIYQQIIGSVDDNNLKLPMDELFQGLRESSNNLWREFEDHVDHEFNDLRQQSEALEYGLLIKGAVLLVVSFIFIALLLVILSRSIKQLDGSIRRLGLGDFVEPVTVEGPADLRYLGNRLEWLRTHLMDLEVSKQQFIHNVALQIDLPLEGIRSAAEQLTKEAELDSNKDQQALAQSLCNNIDKLQAVSKELIRFSQINSKPETIRKAAINMKALLDAVIDNFQATLTAKEISVKKLVRPVEISGIHEQLRHVIEQLLTNAVKYSPTGGEIRIMLRDAGKQMELEVEDEGPGIEPDEREHVFEPFFRGKNAKTEDGSEGLGLGLAIVKEYVANHQGNVEIIDSRHDQQGARIRVQIPLTSEN